MNFITSTIGNLLGKAENTSAIVDTIDDTTDANKPNRSNKGEDQKRRRSAGSPGAQQRLEKRHRPSNVEKRLVGDYTIPKDATPLGPVIVLEDNDWRPAGHNTMPGRAGPVRPVNTLNQSTVQAGTKHTKGSFFNPAPKTGYASTLSTTISAGGNVANRRTLLDHESNGQSLGNGNKRQKLEHGEKASTAVDLTSDEEFAGQPVGIQRRRRPLIDVKALKSSKKSSLDDAFSTDERKRNDAKFGTASNRKHEKRAQGRLEGSQRSHSVRPESQMSVHAYSSEHSSGSGSRQNESARILEQEQRQSNTSSPMRSSQGGSRNVPNIDLTKGLYDISAKDLTRTGSKQCDMADPKGVNKAMGKAPRSGGLRRSTMDPPHSSPRASRGLAGTFQRDPTSGHENPRQRATERMRASGDGLDQSGSSPDAISGDGLDQSGSSPDAISGDRTVKRSAPRSLSPQKGRTIAKLGTHSSTSTRTTQTTKQDLAQPHDDELRIAVRCIYSKQCVRKGRDVALVWHERDQAFFVQDGGENVKLPLRHVPVTLGSKDVRQWCGETDSTKVILKGPRSLHSDGSILIDFFDVAGMRDCHNILCSDDSIRTDFSDPPETLAKKFRNRCQDAEEAYLKFCRTPVDAFTIASQGRRAGEPVNKMEAILYDQDPPTRNSAASRMLESHSRRQVTQQSSDHASNYFEGIEPARRSTRVSRAPAAKARTPTPPPKWSDLNKLPSWPSMVYPMNGARRVTVDRTDIGRLDEGEFLNDNLLSFAMRHIEEHMDPVHRAKVHFFNTFFFTTLNRKKGKSKLDYQAVERWTKSVDLFQKDFVVVPINYNYHWFVAIICNLPNLDRKLEGSDGEDDVTVIAKASRAESENGAFQSAAIGADDAQYVSDGDSYSGKSGVFAFHGNQVLSSATAADEVFESSRPSSKKSGKKSRTAPALRKFDVTKPTIITLDSFGSARTPEIRVLKEYIAAEASAKRGIHVDTSQLQGITAKGIPEQPNFYDCGVYAVGYLKEFAKDPDKFIRKVLRREMKKEDFADFNASETRNDIRENILRLGEEQLQERKAHKKAKLEAKTKASSPPATASQMPPSSLPQSSAIPPLNPSSPPVSSAGVDLPTAAESAPSLFPRSSQTTPSRDTEMDNDDLEVSAPKPLGGLERQHESGLPLADDEMLDVPDELSSTVARDFPTGADPSSVATGVRSQTSPLGSLKKAIRKQSAEAARKEADAAAQDTNDQMSTDSEQGEPEPEIAESQETPPGQTGQGSVTSGSDVSDSDD